MIDIYIRSYFSQFLVKIEFIGFYPAGIEKGGDLNNIKYDNYFFVKIYPYHDIYDNDTKLI